MQQDVMVQFTINDHTGQLTPSSKSSAFQQVWQTGAEHFPQTKSKRLAHLTFVLLDWHIRPLVCLEGRKSSSSPWRIRFKRNIYWAFFRLLPSAEQRLSPSLMRKSRLEQVDIDISAHIMFVSNAVPWYPPDWKKPQGIIFGMQLLLSMCEAFH